ncbi:MAG: hypothetical protein ACP5QR_09470, partial [Rhizomicrobium sp.]
MTKMTKDRDRNSAVDTPTIPPPPLPQSRSGTRPLWRLLPLINEHPWMFWGGMALTCLGSYPVYTSFLNFPLISMAALDSLGLG